MYELTYLCISSGVDYIRKVAMTGIYAKTYARGHHFPWFRIRPSKSLISRKVPGPLILGQSSERRQTTTETVKLTMVRLMS